jgi:hypothetical protein
MEKDTQKTLDKILEALKGLDARVAKMESGEHQPSVAGAKPRAATTRKMSIKEFLLEHSPTNDVLTTLAIGHFFETHEGMASFNRADLEKGYRAAKEKLPSNINVNVNESIRKGHMMETKEKKDNMKAWVITRTGEQYIQNGFKKPSRGK